MCEDCGKKFPFKSILIGHRASSHGMYRKNQKFLDEVEGVYFCRFCPMKGKNKKQLTTHVGCRHWQDIAFFNHGMREIKGVSRLKSESSDWEDVIIID